MTWNLFIDDERNEIDVTWAPRWVREKYRNEEWIAARNWDDVVYLLMIKGFPQFISFDHDLGKNEKTGYDMAKLLVTYLMDGAFELPDGFDYYVHSKNPIGKQNIEAYLDNYLKVVEV